MKHLKKLIVILPLIAILVAGLRLQPAAAWEGCPTGQTGRATFVGGTGGGKYKTCLRTTCSGITFTKVIARPAAGVHMPPDFIVDAVYKIQGGDITGLPYCLPEISDNTGWAYTP